ncbi:hypothetical protein [Antribacter gilvus]|uniref:hypothetical protein n=1 Tax=Antribacter gilvus TaxID=2304675 RepID=UPI000F76F6FB|nr:hypothetical protein [Antribacter gilvus]
MSLKNRILLVTLGAVAMALASEFAGPLPQFLVSLLVLGGFLSFLTALVLPTDLRNPPVHSMTILDRGYMTPTELHRLLGILPPAGIGTLEARGAQWTVARHVCRWRADHVVEVLAHHEVDAVRDREMLSVLQWVGVNLLPAFAGFALCVPLLAFTGFGSIPSNFLQAFALFVVWAALALVTRAVLERYVIHRAVWEPELTEHGTFVER